MHEYLALPVLLGVAAAWVLWKSFRKDRNYFRAWKISLGIAAAYILASYAMALSFAAAVIPADHAMFSATLLFGVGVLVLLRMWYGIPSAMPRPQITVAVFLVLSGICVFQPFMIICFCSGSMKSASAWFWSRKRPVFRKSLFLPSLLPPLVFFHFLGRPVAKPGRLRQQRRGDVLWREEHQNLLAGKTAEC